MLQQPARQLGHREDEDQVEKELKGRDVLLACCVTSTQQTCMRRMLHHSGHLAFIGSQREKGAGRGCSQYLSAAT